ncbi:hypothetical protein FQR65_LT15125 [Abscondita terminalis]|nr:hypothetical protein FQR65_LT15125 [Abscondita terminalis]
MGCPFSKNSQVLQISESKKDSVTMSDNQDYVEDVVCKNSEVGDDEMKVFDLRDVGKVLLIRQNGVLSALGANCTHYGAPLQNGVLGDNRVRCPWHGACFNATTGDIEDFPGLDSLPCYQVKLEGDDVKVRALVAELKSNKRQKRMVKKFPNSNEHFVIIGGGPSGAMCAETLRQEGFQGKITMFTKEKYLPYDRVKLSKAMNVEINSIQLRGGDFYSDYDIDVLREKEINKIDLEHKKITATDDTTVNFDRVYIATGSSPRKVNIPGGELKNVVVLRSYDDASHINSLLSPEKHVVVLGSSFIGMEAAAFCLGKVARVTVVSKSAVPFDAVFGNVVGSVILKLFQEKEGEFVPNNGLAACFGNEDNELVEVKLNDGAILKADICILGIGSTLNTEFLKGSGISMTSYGAVDVNEYLQTNVPNVFAGGDIAFAPIWSHGNNKGSIGHYGLSQYHGKIAAMNMMNKGQCLKSIPFFWTMLLGKSFRYCGYGVFDDVVIRGDISKLVFAAYYIKNDEVVAMCACGMDPIVSKYAEYVAQGNKLYRKDLEKDPLDWTK